MFLCAYVGERLLIVSNVCDIWKIIDCSMLADILDWIQIGFSYHDCVFQNKCFCVPMLVDYWLSVMFATFGYFRLNSDWISYHQQWIISKWTQKSPFICDFFIFYFLVELYIRMEYQKIWIIKPDIRSQGHFTLYVDF